MVKKSIFSLGLSLFLLALSLSPPSFAKDSLPDSKANLRQKIQNDIIDLFKKHDVEIRDSIDLDDSLTALDCSNTGTRKLHPNAWSRPLIEAYDNQLLLVYKNQKYILVEGGPELHYQPLYHTKERLKFFIRDIENSSRSYGKHTLLIVKEDSLAITRHRGRTILLKPGFHWLKKGESRPEFLNIETWLKSVKSCNDSSDAMNAPSGERISSGDDSSDTDDSSDSSSDDSSSDDKPRAQRAAQNKAIKTNAKVKDSAPSSCVHHKSFGGFTLEKVIANASGPYRLRPSHDGVWHILKPGINIYPPGLAPIGDIIDVDRGRIYSVKKLAIAQTGFKISISFSLSVPTENMFLDIKKTAKDDRSYAHYLSSVSKARFDIRAARAKTAMNNTVALVTSNMQSDQFDLASFKHKLQDELDKTVKEFNDKEEQDSYLRVKRFSFDIDADTVREHQESLGNIKRSIEKNKLEEELSEKKQSFKLKSREAAEELDHQLKTREHDRNMEQLKIEYPYKIAQAKAEEATAQAQEAKEKRKKLEQKKSRSNY